MGRVSVALLVAVGLMQVPGLAWSQSSPSLYVPNEFDNTVSVIDTGTNVTVGTPIPVPGTYTDTVAVRGDQAFVYTANENGTVSVIDTASNSVVSTINVGSQPYLIALSPDGSRAYVTNHSGNSVSVINTANNSVVTTIPVGGGPYGVAVSPDGTRAYVTNEGSGTVSVINTTSNSVIATITVGSTATDVTISPDGTRVYVSNYGSGTVSLINTASNTVAATVTVGGAPLGVTVSPNGTRIYVANENGTVSVLNATNNSIVATINVGSADGIVISADGTHVYVSHYKSSETVTVIDTFTNSVVGTINVGSVPEYLGICSNGNALLTSGLTFKANTSGALGCTGKSGPVFTGGNMQFAGVNIMSPLPIMLMAAGGTFDTSGNNATLSGAIGGPGGLSKIGLGVLTLSGSSTYTGVTLVNGGTLQAGAVNAFSPLSAFRVATGASLDLNGFSQVIGGLTGTGAVANSGGGNPTLTIAAGGIFAPGSGIAGSSMAMTANLAFQSGAIYSVQINPASSSFANVTGTATLSGATVHAVFASGSYVSKQYTILTATGGLGGSSFSGISNANLPSGFTDSLSYDPTHAYLNLALSFMPPPGSPPRFSSFNVNQQNVASALINFFNASGSIPMVFGILTPAGLTQASGELATGTQQTTFDAMNLFMGVLTDPFLAGRGNPVSASVGVPGYADAANAYASDGKLRSQLERDVYAAAYTKAPPANPVVQRWTVWSAAYGGSQTTDGNVALGSNTTTSSIYGTVVGADYRISPDTLAGFGLAGGGTSFSIASGLGSGRSDLFQAGAYVRHNQGPAYVSAALAYGWQDITTNRTVPVVGAAPLHAEFNANVLSGRLEGGYRHVLPWMGITPYAAAQFTRFDLPSYAESGQSGAGTFALAYNATGVTGARSEFGLRTDRSWAMTDSNFTLRGRVAWAHDCDPNRTIAATFQTLPGASFVVSGAAQARDSALTTASAELRWRNSWSVAVTSEGAFSHVTSSYAGKGVVRYNW